MGWTQLTKLTLGKPVISPRDLVALLSSCSSLIHLKLSFSTPFDFGELPEDPAVLTDLRVFHLDYTGFETYPELFQSLTCPRLEELRVHFPDWAFDEEGQEMQTAVSGSMASFIARSQCPLLHLEFDWTLPNTESLMRILWSVSGSLKTLHCPSRQYHGYFHSLSELMEMLQVHAGEPVLCPRLTKLALPPSVIENNLDDIGDLLESRRRLPGFCLDEIHFTMDDNSDLKLLAPVCDKVFVDFRTAGIHLAIEDARKAISLNLDIVELWKYNRDLERVRRRRRLLAALLYAMLVFHVLYLSFTRFF
uniref:F-box domain-containing protein n=1 Tax=Mycena chlorophos TaxID=658473 RepID=A0ABQ0KU68_MYCCL|nr:predicted protein [Mycena chlorophos]